MRFSRLVCVTAALLSLSATNAQAQAQAQAQAPAQAQAAPVDSTVLSGFRWRSIGPANMGGRITDVEGIPYPSRTFYVAAAAGGIWKTTNAGTTFQPVFDHEGIISMGDIAIARSDTNVVYAGTGEEDSCNSISPGGGVYKTTDGARTWKFMGLGATQQIGRIVVHPTNPNIAYVAALGHVWGSNKERGLYKTTDGGTTWALSKFVSDHAGFVDVAMDPSDPNTLYAASWERVRGPWFLKSGGPGSALWKTTDAGATWSEIRGGGFPSTMKGRIGIAIAPSNPRTVYALVEADSARNPVRSKSAKGRQKLQNGLYRSNDAGATWTRMNDHDVRPFYYSQVRVDSKNPDRVYWSSTPVNFSDDGGRTVRNATIGIHVDHHAMWIDPNDPAHIIVGDDGGVSQTWDKGGNYSFLNIMPLGQFYEVSYDMAIPYRVCGGLQDNGSWCGPSRRRQGGITNSMWFNVGGGDGFYTAQDPTDSDAIYAESQGGAVGRLDYATGERTQLRKPSYAERYGQYEDSIVVARGDTVLPAPTGVTRRIGAIRAKQVSDSVIADIRFNWETPFFLSAHAPRTLYIGGSRVLKSTDRGDHLYPISPDLSTRDTARIHISTTTTGGITKDATGAETYGTTTALAESPFRPGILYAGTDDGNLWLTRNDGATWENLTGRAHGVPRGSEVRRIEPSSHDSATFYVAFDNHKQNDFTPYLFVTTDMGRTFRSIARGLPSGGPDYVHVIREDPVNRDLLFVGTDVGAYVSTDRGATWQRFMAGLPTVPVRDLRIQPRDHELIAATHGRSVWITDIAPLEQWADTTADRGRARFFAPTAAYEFGEPPMEGQATGQQAFSGTSVPYGAALVYRLPAGVRDSVRFVVQNSKGDTLRTLASVARAGINRVYWDFRLRPKSVALSPSQRRDSIVFARRIDEVVDSMASAGASRDELTRIRTQLLTGGRGFGGNSFGGAAQGGRFVPRPAESRAPRSGSRRGAERDTARGTARDTGAVATVQNPAGRGATESDTTRQDTTGRAAQSTDEPPINSDLLREVMDLVRTPGSLYPPSDRRQPPMVDTGDYLVTMTAAGETHRQVLRVVRPRGVGDETGGGDNGDDDDNP
ncbi:MAG: WD40/YVTN/BNR-like repeat-containing protein [Gemmatimonadaceae bacterium]